MQTDSQHQLDVARDIISGNTQKNLDDHFANRSFPTDIAALYQFVRPLLVFVEGLLMFKPDWAKAIAALIAGLDIEFQSKPAATKKTRIIRDSTENEEGITKIPGLEK